MSSDYPSCPSHLTRSPSWSPVPHSPISPLSIYLHFLLPDGQYCFVPLLLFSPCCQYADVASLFQQITELFLSAWVNCSLVSCWKIELINTVVVEVLLAIVEILCYVSKSDAFKSINIKIYIKYQKLNYSLLAHVRILYYWIINIDGLLCSAL